MTPSKKFRYIIGKLKIRTLPQKGIVVFLVTVLKAKLDCTRTTPGKQVKVWVWSLS